MLSSRINVNKTSVEDSNREASASSRNSLLPFHLCWTFGHENRIAAHNLSSEERKCIFFVSGNVGVLYDWIENKQLLFQSHKNNIECVASSADKNWVATVDKGAENSLVIWDTHNGLPQRVINDSFGEGVAFLQFTTDYLFILSNGKPQHIYLWKWKLDSEMPRSIYQFATDFEHQHYSTIHPNCSNHFFTCGLRKVVFFEMVKGKLISHVPPLQQQEFLVPIGDFIQATYVLNSQLALTSTILGNVLLWGNIKAVGRQASDCMFVDPRDRFPLRLMQPHEEKEPIFVLGLSDCWIVSGNALGYLYFWDAGLEVVYCCKDFNCGSINHVSFSRDADLSAKMNIVNDIVEDTAKNSKSFQCRDFTISTSKGYCGYFSVAENKLTTVLYESDYSIRALAVNPVDPHICFGDYDGHLQTWNYETKKLVTSVHINDTCREIECMSFDPTGKSLACGLTNGKILIFDSCDITEMPKFTFDVCNTKVTICKFSPDSKHLTFADESYAIVLFRLYCILPTLSVFKKAATEAKESWKFVGKERQHYRAIVDLLYSNPVGEEHLFLYTLAEDRNLVIYDVTECSQDVMSIVNVLPVEQTAIPTCMSWYPFFQRPSLLAIVNNEHKIKIHDLKYQKCLKVNLLPIYDSPFRKAFIISEQSDEVESHAAQLKYFVFRTDHHIGLLILPVDGNPYNAAAISTHILGVKDVAKDPNDKWLFSCGTEDRWIHMWKIKSKAVCMSAVAGGKGIEPFMDLLPTGDPQLIKDKIMNTVFALQLQRIEHGYPAQIKLKQEISVEELDYIMAALGYYPSQYEFSMLMEDAKFSLMLLNNEDANTIDLDEVIKLFVNHRPVEPVTVDRLASAFKTICGLKDDDAMVPRSVFLRILEEFGEPIYAEEMCRLVTILQDHSPPSTDMDELFVSYCKDDDYYTGGDGKMHGVYVAQDKMVEDTVEDWSGLDSTEFAPEEEEEDSSSDNEQSPSDNMDEAQEAEIESVGKQVKKDLNDLLPERLSKKNFICDLLGFEYPSEEEAKKG